VPEYVLDHHYKGERERLALMSELLDPMHRRHIERMGVGPGARTLEVGCGNGSISAWLAKQVAPGGRKELIDTFLAYCRDPGWWTQTIAFTAVAGRVSKDRLDG